MKKTISLSTLLLLSVIAYTQSVKPATDTVYKNFLTPPAAARPRVWWHWMNGNITKDGIRKDLEWMHRSGIGGFQNFDASLGTPQVVANRLTYMTPEWKDAFRFTAKLADSLHLEMAIAGSPGWSETGGPWVKKEDGMKKIVWSETFASAGASNIKLKPVPTVTGPFQNIAKQADFGEAVDNSHLPAFYKDIAVIAYRLPGNDIPIGSLNPVVTSSGGHFDLTQLTDGDLAISSLLPPDTTTSFAWIQFAFEQPQTIKAITMMGGGDKGPFGLYGELKDNRSLEKSDDGIHFQWICFIPAGAVLQQTIAIPPTTAKYFRITVKNPPPVMNLGAMLTGKYEPPTPSPGTEIAEIVLHPASRINMFEEKDAFAPAQNLYNKATPASTDVVDPSSIMDLTNKLNADGSLNWTVPAGNWNVVRFGYSLMGITNHPASPEATGPEVDKLDPIAIRNYFTNYLDQYKSATAGLMGTKGGLQFMVTDSWEAGAQNWTANMLQEFQQRRGYSMLHWLPVLTGHIVKSAEASELFLLDYRKTLSNLVTEYHYDALTKILQQYGMKRYSESHESGRALIADGMEVKRTAAIPMSAMWAPGGIGGGENMHIADIRESASVAHIYGQNIAAAESLTAMGIGGSAWSYYPEKLKPTADLEMASGLNRFVIHTSVHQPVDDKIPGLGLGPFGQWFTRHETWAAYAKTWTDYLARSCYMLQQGKFIADIIYYYGDDNNITSLFGVNPPAIPEGYNFDYVNTDALIKLLSVKDGKIITPSGMRYRILVLDSNARYMSLPALRKLRDLVKAGAAIAGVQAEFTSGLAEDPNEFKAIAVDIWSGNRKNVLSGKKLEQVLNELQIVPDVSYTKTQKDTRLLFVHRQTPDRDIYWIDNRNNRVENTGISFRTAGKTPVLWHPETGVTEAVSYSIANGVTKINMHLEPYDAVFVVFKDKALKTSVAIAPVTEKIITTLTGDWNLQFQEKRGAPAAVTVNELKSWSDNNDAGIKYFSGTGTYTKTFSADAAWFANGAAIYIDLGSVKNMAEVLINGKSVGVVWKKPFRVNATQALKPGTNTIVIKVTNLWVNRVIGDAQPGVEKKITYTTIPFFQANSPLQPSGLLGPVNILSLSR